MAIATLVSFWHRHVSKFLDLLTSRRDLVTSNNTKQSTMKKTIILLSVILISLSGFSQSEISGTSPQKDVNIGMADYSNGIPMLITSQEFIEPSGNKLLDADESAQIKVVITNNGSNSAFEVGATMSCNNTSNITFDKSKTIGEIPAGKSKTIYFNIKANQYISNSERTFSINFS